jgi:hypothetical protein
MKNISKALLMSLGAFALLFPSCSEDYPERTPSPVPSENCIQVYFPKTDGSVLEVEPTTSSVEVTISRVTSTAAATIPLTKIDKAGVFTIPESVSFAAGESSTKFTVSFANLDVFVRYQLEIKVGDEFINPYVENTLGTTNFLLFITQSDWADYASGTFKSGFFEDSWTQTLQYSKILESYRFPDLWATGYNYVFKWDGGKEITPGGTINSSGLYVQASGYVHSKYGMIMTQTDPDPAYTNYNADTKTFDFNMKWTVDAGSFGWTDELFTIEKTL